MAEIAFFTSFPRCGADGHRLVNRKLLLCGWCRWTHLCVHQRRHHLRHLAGPRAVQPQGHCAGPNHGVSLFSHLSSFQSCTDWWFFYHSWCVQMSWIRLEQKRYLYGLMQDAYIQRPELGFTGMQQRSCNMSSMLVIFAHMQEDLTMIVVLLMNNLYHDFLLL